MADYFQYGEKEVAYLKQADKHLAEVMDKIGRVEREIIPDLFEALVHVIVGQQISAKAHESVWKRVRTGIERITPEAVDRLSLEELRGFGISRKKAAAIQNVARKILYGDFDLDALHALDDDEVRRRLSSLDGIGVWSAEMLMLFSMQRPDILSYGDLAIQRGLQIIYHHREIDRKLFEKYRRRFSPYGSVASLYLWTVARGALSKVIYTQPYHTPCGDLRIGSFEGKLCLCDWVNGKHRDSIERRLQTILQAHCKEASSAVLQKVTRQLDEYFAGKRKRFDIPLLTVGSDFQKRVWQALLDIPYGGMISYGELAVTVGQSKAVRAVANAIGGNAISIFIPCHRVIGGNRSLTGYEGGLTAKKCLLELEQAI